MSSDPTATAAAKSLQSCPTLCDPVPGILQARTLEWAAISFSNAWKWKLKVKSLSHVRLLATPWTAAYQAPPSVGFSRQEDWSGCHCLLQGSHLKVWFDVLPSLVWQMLQHFVSVDSFHKYILSNLTHSFEPFFNNFQAICGLTFSFFCHWYRNIYIHTTELSQLSNIFSWITNFKNNIC